MALANPARIPSYEERSACEALSYNWAESYDIKNWALLSSILAPTLYIDYTAVTGSATLFPAQSAADFTSTMSSPSELGNPLVATQHLLGAARWRKDSETRITATWQARASHVRFVDNGKGGRGKEIVATAVGHGPVEHFYEKVEGEDGVWKFKGVRPEIWFWEGDMRTVMGWKG